MKLIEKLYEQAEKVVGTKINNYLTIMSINYEYHEHSNRLDITIALHNSYNNKTFNICSTDMFTDYDEAIILTFYVNAIENNFAQTVKIGTHNISILNGHRTGYIYPCNNAALIFPATSDDYVPKAITLYTKQ